MRQIKVENTTQKMYEMGENSSTIPDLFAIF